MTKPLWHSTVQACAHSYGVTADSIMGLGSRDRTVSKARFVVWYVMHHRDGKGHTLIASYFGGMDHSSVSYGLARIKSMLEWGDPEITELVAAEMARREPITPKHKRAVDPAAHKAKHLRRNEMLADDDALSRLRGSAALLAAIRREHPDRCVA